MHLFLLGRQPAIGLAELESLLGGQALQRIGGHATLVRRELPADFFQRLGGSIKQVSVVDTFAGTGWNDIESYAKRRLAKSIPFAESGKLQCGISVYNCQTNARRVGALGLSLKKQLQRSMRIVAPTDQPYLQSAQIIGNKLTGPQGREIVFYCDAGTTYVGYTIAEQDINAYTKRDQARPKRDAKVGMLPPKLAQTLINLAAGNTDQSNTTQRLLDPFCGTGVVLQEAALMGYELYGTDLEPRMIQYTQDNLVWLDDTLQPLLETADATNHTWQQPIDLVAAETYLGRPFAVMPPADTLMDAVSTCNIIIKRFLQNIHGQLAPGTRLCLAVPAWQVRTDSFKHLPLLDLLEEMGYNYVSFEHVERGKLLYYRPDQIVGRQLIVITRK